ncbi:MAG: PRC-barrel domain-containing protein [Gemmobacter sp.]|uniref:PRC-barrel domain-containing protein n=1 Tax=Gemmobacter sp. TaxID=1898957 RepID=UPI001A41DD6F|nr:PRC-barrel domain-containing protein [Gemmobacter sp.]MBL8561059.1 PRC-barrel domain-containing protein [Gemmobacter sp.]
MMLRNLVRAVVPVAGPAAALVAALAATLAATPVQAQAALPPGLEPVPPETWTAEMLLGAEVRDLAAESVAAVRDVQLSPEGRLQGLLVEIGGLWGIGARTVAVPLTQVTVARPADAPVKGEVRVHLAISADALKSLPEVEG